MLNGVYTIRTFDRDYWNAIICHILHSTSLLSIQSRINVNHFSIRWSKLKSIPNTILYTIRPHGHIYIYKKMIRYLSYKNLQVKRPFPSEYIIIYLEYYIAIQITRCNISIQYDQTTY